MLAREQFGMRGDLQSDSACVLPLTQALLPLAGLRFMRDPTRGGLAMIAHEIRHATGMGIYMDEAAIPVREAVESVCELLGYDPLYLACEGRVVAVVAPDQAPAALAAWRALPQGQDAAVIGKVDKTEAFRGDADGARRRAHAGRTGGRPAAADLLIRGVGIRRCNP